MSWTRAELSYCSNVHPGESLSAVEEGALAGVAAVRRERGLPRMAAGLWLSAAAAQSLEDSSTRNRFAMLLDYAGVDLCTLNGFPFGNFHAERVKENVYRPDWAETDRLDYTLSLARTLAELIPPTQRYGSISTLPLGYSGDWDEARHQAALQHLCRCAADLADLHERSGRWIRIGLEPEPGCVIESSEQAGRLLTEDLPRVAQRSGVARETLEAHVGVCFDVCHQAVMFEDPASVLGTLLDCGVPIVKIQLSNAIELAEADDESARGALSAFAQSRYLHQVRALCGDGGVAGASDLPEAMAGEITASGRWRVHCHVPLHAENMADGLLGTTCRAVGRTLDALACRPQWRPHLEVETYTWGTLPTADRADDRAQLAQSIGRELTWLEAELVARGLLDEGL